MKVATLIIILGFLLIHMIFSALAIMQARRLKNLTRTNKLATTSYLISASTVWIIILITFFTIEF